MPSGRAAHKDVDGADRVTVSRRPIGVSGLAPGRARSPAPFQFGETMLARACPPPPPVRGTAPGMCRSRRAPTSPTPRTTRRRPAAPGQSRESLSVLLDRALQLRTQQPLGAVEPSHRPLLHARCARFTAFSQLLIGAAAASHCGPSQLQQQLRPPRRLTAAHTHARTHTCRGAQPSSCTPTPTIPFAADGRVASLPSRTRPRTRRRARRCTRPTRT